MSDLYNRIYQLCLSRGISIGKMCSDLGISRGNLSDLKMDRIKFLSTKKTETIANYFGVSIEYLLTGTEKAPTPKDERISDEDIKFALFGGDGDITDEMFEEVKQFAQFIREREKGK